MEQNLKIRTKSAQYAVQKARKTIAQNEKIVEKIYQNFGHGEEFELQQKLMLKDSKNHLESKKFINLNEENYKINTNSKVINYFNEIINSIY